jgi:predicted nuclease with TOPRIM domain
MNLMDVFLILQILFDAVLLFGILFLFHFFVNQQQRKKEEFDIVKNIQIQEMKENLEKLLSTMKQLGEDISDDIQKKITEFEEKTESFNDDIKIIEREKNFKFEMSKKESNEEDDLKNKIKIISTPINEKVKLISKKKGIDKNISGLEKKKKEFNAKPNYSTGFSSGVIKQVYKMVDGNCGIGEVVKVTKLTKAEISLILNLRENRFTAPN